MSTETIYIICEEDGSEKVVVEPTEAKLLTEKSDYFRAMFEHGTIETDTDSRTICKSWSKSTTEHIISLICKSSTKVKSLLELKQLLIACDEILLGITMYEEEVNIDSISEEILSSPEMWVLEWKPPMWMEGPSFDTIYHKVKEKGILIVPQDGLQLKVRETTSELPPSVEQTALQNMVNMLGSLRFDSDSTSFQKKPMCIHFPESISVPQSILLIADAIKGNNTTKKVFTYETVSLRFILNISSIVSLKGSMDAIKEKFNLKSSYIHSGNSPGFYLSSQGYHGIGAPTFSGSYSSLYGVMELLESLGHLDCDVFSLRITAPSSSTLNNLINAVSSCEKHPSTLGLDEDANAFYAIKTKEDMLRLLKGLSENHPISKEKKDIPLKLESLKNNHKGGVF